MFLSILLYGGFASAMLGACGLLSKRNRRAGVFAAAAGILSGALALAWPARPRRAATRASRLDELMPEWQFNEVHSARVSASPERVFDVIQEVTPREILFFKMLTTIRGMGRPAPESIINAPSDEPLLHLATRTTFRYVAHDRPHEIVVATHLGPKTTAMMNFLVAADDHGGSIVTTETRVFAATEKARRRFALYWRIIQPGSDIIRRMWLRAIKRRAERTPAI